MENLTAKHQNKLGMSEVDLASPPAPKRRAADVAYDAIEARICTLQLPPGSPINEAELAAKIDLGRTPVREALLRMVSIGLIVQQPRRGLLVSDIDLVQHLDLIQTRRALEHVIAKAAARRATGQQRKALVQAAEKMEKAAGRGNLESYMSADHELDSVIHAASRNSSAVKAVVPLAVQCRRFWYAFQHEGDIVEAARRHMNMAASIASGVEKDAAAGVDGLMDYLEQFARRVIDK